VEYYYLLAVEVAVLEVRHSASASASPSDEVESTQHLLPANISQYFSNTAFLHMGCSNNFQHIMKQEIKSKIL